MQTQHAKNLNPERFELGTTLSWSIRSIVTSNSKCLLRAGHLIFAFLQINLRIKLGW